MTDYFKLIQAVSDEYDIKKSKTESEPEWIARVVYSYLGQMGYASLSDINDDGILPSIVSFQKRIKDVLTSFVSIYPEIRSLFAPDSNIISDEIYDCMLTCGCFYHQRYHLTMPQKRISEYEGIVFLRGYGVEEHRYLSGLGAFLLTEVCDEERNTNITEMFQLPETTLLQDWQQITDNRRWQVYDGEKALEYLNTRLSSHNNEWLNHPEKSDIPSLARSQESDGKTALYYLYYTQKNQLMLSQLPEWQTTDAQYRLIVAACLYQRNNLPVIQYQQDNTITKIRFSYLLPPSELNLIRLYSWPKLYRSFPCDFERIMDTRVFVVLRSILEQRGYSFKEV